MAASVEDVEFEKGKGKKSGKKRGEGKNGLDKLDSRPVSDADPHRKKKKKMKQEEEDSSQIVEDGQKKKRKRMKEDVTPTLDSSQIVEDGLKKKEKKTKEDVTPTLDSSQIVEDGQRKKKRKKTKEDVTPTLDSSQIVEDGLKKKKKEKKTKEDVTPTLDSSQIVEDGLKKKKEKKTKEDGTPTLDSSQIVEDGLMKKEKKKKEDVTPTLDSSQIVEDGLKKKKEKKTKEDVTPTLDSSQIVEDGLKKKKEKKTKEDVTPTLDSSQIVEDGLMKKEKKKKEDVTPTLDSSQIVEDGLKKKKEKKTEDVTPTLDSSQIVEDGLKKKKEKKTKEDVTPTLDSSQIVEDGLKKNKKKKTKEDVTPTLDSSQIVEDGQKRKKRKFTTKLPASDPSQAVENCGPVTGSAKKTILKSQKLETSTGAELEGKKKDKKKVTFQLPDRLKFEPSENKLLGEETEFEDLESFSWKDDKLRPGLVYGMYTAEEDGILKQAIFDYIQEQGWDREEGLEKILNSKKSEARGCWHVIRKCLPQREVKRIWGRAHRILGHGTGLGKWTNEEEEALLQLYSMHGNDWKRIGTTIGRDPGNVRDKWRQLKFTKSKDYKRGPWSEEEQQKLCKLVLKCLHVKAQMAKKAPTPKTHHLLRDDINWEFVAEQMGGRARLACLEQWYGRMASPMVTTGEWSNSDDQRLLKRLMEEFPLSEELVDWGSLLKNRSGDTCKKRWEQMQRTLGRGPEVRHLHFLEKLESIMKRFAPHILDTEYDQKFAEDMLRADADELEDEDL